MRAWLQKSGQAKSSGTKTGTKPKKGQKSKDIDDTNAEEKANATRRPTLNKVFAYIQSLETPTRRHLQSQFDQNYPSVAIDKNNSVRPVDWLEQATSNDVN